jgi:hypothetical protein
MCLLLKPTAASVPISTDPMVAKKAIIKLFFAAKPHGFFVPHTISLYHLVEKASGSSFFIPSEKTKNSSPLNDNGKITNKGAIKYIKTHEHINR